MSFIDDYKEIRKCFISFKKRQYFDIFSSADIFYVIDSFGKKAILTFIDQFFGTAKGLQVFNNRDGINYVHDVLSTEDEYSVTVGDCDSIVAVFKEKKDLTDEDIIFLNKMEQKKTLENNLIIYRFKKGYRYTYAKNSEIKIISEYVVFLNSLIPNEELSVIEAFNENRCVLASFNKERLEYSCIYRSLPYLEIMPNRSPINFDFVNEYKDHLYLNEDCYLFTSYLPVAVKGSGIRPLLCYFYFVETGAMELKYIISDPKDYKNIIYGILDEIFTKIGLPAKMIINNRDLYCILTKTLDELNIENTFERDNLRGEEDVSFVVSNMYQKTQDTEMEEEEIIAMFNFLFQALEKEDTMEYLSDEPKENDSLVS